MRRENRPQVLQCKDDLMYFMGRDYIERCEKLLAYENSGDDEFEPLWELYGEVCNEVEQNYYTPHLNFLKHITHALIRNGVYDANEARLVIADEMQKDFLSVNGLMAIYVAGVMQLDDLIPQFVELMHRDDDELVPILQEAMISLQSEELAKAVAPHILNTESGMFITASTILKEAKTPFAEQVLVEAYPQATDIDMKEFFLDALTSQFSPKAFTLIEDFLAQNKLGRAFDMDEMFYSFYKAMQMDHPSLSMWRGSVMEREERFGKEISPFLVKDFMREEFGKIGRNDPCVCGSGKKYKKCCGK